jgi:glycosyltransferase involved in cell wall biosynthesis
VRIAQVITLFLPDFVGGATLACADLARGLRARGHDVSVFCGRPQGDATPYAESTWEVDGLPVTGVNAAPGYAALDPRSYRHPEIVPAFTRFLERTRPDVVHFHSIQALGADLLAVAAERRVPVVVTMHDWWWWCARLFLVDQHDFVCPPRVASARCHCAPGFDLVERRRHLAAMLAHADRVLAPSRFLADAAIANGVPPVRVVVCANGVARRDPQGERRPGPVRFGYFGGPDHRLKGLPTLLAAADRLDCGGFELVLHVGTKAARRRLTRRLADRVGYELAIPFTLDDRVRLMPAFAPTELPAVFTGIDCLIVPSLMRESYSLVTREALAAGVPVIASDSGGPGEVILPERNGLLFATADTNDLAHCLRRFVLEPGLADALREGAAATPIPTLAAQVRQLEDVYTELQPAADRAPAAAAISTAPALGPVLFLAGCDGAPFRYRVTHLRDALAARGIASRAVWWSDPGVPAAIAEAEIVVVYRVPMTPWLDACLAYARGLGRTLVFSCDDLLFDPATTPHDALAALPENQRVWWLAATERYATTLRTCDGFLATTEPLAAAAARIGVPAFVVRNGLGERELAVVEQLRKTAITRGSEIVLTYLSGTTMHDLDFAVIAPTLGAVLAARPGVRLRLGGHLLPHPALAAWQDRIERLPFLPWQEMLGALAASDVQMVPLRLGDSFTDAKSEVKYLEAGALGIPTIASPTDAFRRGIRHGENGLLTATTRQWESGLLALIDDSGFRHRLGNRARDDVFLHATPAAQAAALIEALATIRDRRPLSAAATAVTAPDPTSFPAETGRSDLEPENLHPGTAVEASDTPSAFLAPGHSVGQRFRASDDGLCRIDVRVGIDGRPRRHRLVVHVGTGADGPPLRRVTVDTATIADQAWVAASFEPIADSAGRDLYVWITSADAGDGDGVTLWTYVRGHGDTPPGGLHIDHRAAAGSLTFRTYHRRAGG